MVGQINNVLCYFNKVGAVPKLKLLKSFCSSLYDYELSNLFHVAISDVYTAQCQELRRVWLLPYNMHRVLLAPLSDSIPFMDEICPCTLSLWRTA